MNQSALSLNFSALDPASRGANLPAVLGGKQGQCMDLKSQISAIINGRSRRLPVHRPPSPQRIFGLALASFFGLGCGGHHEKALHDFCGARLRSAFNREMERWSTTLHLSRTLRRLPEPIQISAT